MHCPLLPYKTDATHCDEDQVIEITVNLDLSTFDIFLSSNTTTSQGIHCALLSVFWRITFHFLTFDKTISGNNVKLKGLTTSIPNLIADQIQQFMDEDSSTILFSTVIEFKIIK